ncbi:c-type cytochrome [Flavobacterium sp.]|uniref:c-type cytochrome n=2 Tax=Flavobacterium sp. TaxID=239 RepID=UPI0040342E33
MKRIMKYMAVPALAMALLSCESNTYEDLQDNPVVEGNVTYEQHVKPIIAANCLSCHGDGGVSSFRPLGTYAELKDAIQNTNLLDRIQRQNGEPGLMPQTGRMPQSNINMIVEWNMDGLLEN